MLGHEHHHNENGTIQHSAPLEIRTDVSALNPSLIQRWVEYRQMTVPQWDTDSKSCKHCNEKTKRGRRHNCRLCGYVFCSECTSKYHLPPQFRRKGKRMKEGITRVCFGCRDECLEVRKQVKNQEIVLRPGLQKKFDDGITTIGVPQWQEIELTKECVDCLTPFTGKKSGTHHCRICGHLFCPLCTIKMDIPLPSRFRKKGKSGSSRVCLECRYLYFSGIRLDGGDGDTFDSADFAKMRREGMLDKQPSLTAGRQPQRSFTSDSDFTGRESPASMSSQGPPPFMGNAPTGMPPPPTGRSGSPGGMHQQGSPGPPPFPGAGGHPQYGNGAPQQYGGPPSNGGPPRFGGPPNGYSNGGMPNGGMPPMNPMSAPSTPKFMHKSPTQNGPSTPQGYNRSSMNYPRNDVSPPLSMGSQQGRGPPRFSPPTNGAYGNPPSSQSYGAPPQGSPFSSNTGPPSFVNHGGRPGGGGMSPPGGGGPPSTYGSPYGNHNGNNGQQRRFSNDQQSSSPRTPAWARNGVAPPGPHTHPPPAPHLGGGPGGGAPPPPPPNMGGGPPPPPNFGAPPNMGGPPSNMMPPPPGGLGGPPPFGNNSNRFAMNRSMSQSSHGSVDSINLNAPSMSNSSYNQMSPPQSPAMNDRFAQFQRNNGPPAPVPPPIINGPKAPPLPPAFNTPPSNTPTTATSRSSGGGGGGGGGLLSEIASGRTALRSANKRELNKPATPGAGGKQQNGDMFNLLREKLNVRNAQVADDSDEEWSSSDG